MLGHFTRYKKIRAQWCFVLLTYLNSKMITLLLRSFFKGLQLLRNVQSESNQNDLHLQPSLTPGSPGSSKWRRTEHPGKYQMACLQKYWSLIDSKWQQTREWLILWTSDLLFAVSSPHCHLNAILDCVLIKEELTDLFRTDF